MTNRPIHKLRDGTVQASVWENTREDGRPFYGVSFTRRYRDAAGEWHDSDNYSGGDLLKLQRLIGEAYDFVKTQEEADRRRHREDDPQ